MLTATWIVVCEGMLQQMRYDGGGGGVKNKARQGKVRCGGVVWVPR